LSRERAETVAAALKAKGIAADRLATKGFGKADPRYPNSNEEARARNRRVEIVVED
jgi:OmpA-OmpF porin, OOP family